jgi:hypothetical protein
MATEGGEITGTKDKAYNLIWFVEQSLSNALRLETYIEDAECEGDSISPTSSSALRAPAARAASRARHSCASGSRAEPLLR